MEINSRNVLINSNTQRPILVQIGREFFTLKYHSKLSDKGFIGELKELLKTEDIKLLQEDEAVSND